MNIGVLRKVSAIGILLLIPFAEVGCRKKEPPRGTGGEEAITLSALNEIENYKEILRKDPNNLQALINIGNLYFDTRQDRLGIHHYRTLPAGAFPRPAQRERQDRHGHLLPADGKSRQGHRGTQKGDFSRSQAPAIPVQPGSHPDL